MIHAINTRTEYGKGTMGIYPLTELSDGGETVYAHSLEQAMAWAKGYPLYADVQPESLGDGRLVLKSAWIEGVQYASVLFGYEEVTHTRQVLTICPVNTVFETTGHKR